MKSNLKELYKKNKISFILSGISIFAFLFVLVGATFAYLSLDINNNASKTDIINYSGDKVNVAVSGSANINMNLSLNDMKKYGTDVTYFASKNGTTTTNPHELLATFINESSTSATCNYVIEATKSPINGVADMLTSLVLNGHNNEIMLYIKDDIKTLNTVDFKNSTWTNDNKLIFSGTIDNLTKGEHDLYIEYIVNNFKDIIQSSYLSNTGINLSLKIKSIVCSAEANISPKFSLKTNYFEKRIDVSLIKNKVTPISYCINNEKQSIVNCSWKNISGDSFSEIMSNPLIYYVHVKGSNGIIGSSKAINFTKFSGSLSDFLVTKLDTWQSNLEGDGYRFVGSGNATSPTTPNNFICFGTTDKTACKANENKYLYRIIGVFDDASGNKHAKLIKYKQLGAYAWNADQSIDIPWEQSDLYEGLNGSYFVSNATYDYMQNSTWNNKIENWTWSAVNTKSGDGGISYIDGASPSNMYLHEMNRTTKTSSIGSWTTPLSKIGLMYASDYTLSLGETAKSMTTGTNASKDALKTGWMHQTNNDTAIGHEWTISRGGLFNSSSIAWLMNKSGIIDNNFVRAAYAVRPVFYLTSNTMYSGGRGSYADPVIIN